MKKPGSILAATLFAFVVLLSTVCGGCKTIKLQEKTNTKDSVVFKDTTVFVKLPPIIIPGDQVTLHDTVPCPDVIWKGTAKSESGRTTVTAELNKGHLNIECQTDSLLKAIDSLKAVIKAKESWHQEVKQTTVTVPEPFIPWWIYAILGGEIVLLIWELIKRCL